MRPALADGFIDPDVCDASHSQILTLLRTTSPPTSHFNASARGQPLIIRGGAATVPRAPLNPSTSSYRPVSHWDQVASTR